MRRLEAGMRLHSFRLEARLGGSHGGEVWRVTGPGGEALALKARPRRSPDAAGFRREFERLRALRLPAVVRVRAFGEAEGYLFFTMDLAEGVPFDAYVQQSRSSAGRLRRAATAGSAVATALAGIHRLGLAHRDLNPHNILVRDDGQPTLLDFGAGESQGGAIRAGTAAYMAPEVRLGLPSDHRADSYALGVMLYEAVAGRPDKAPPGRPRPALAHDPAIPLAYSDLIDRALSLDPLERPDGEAFAAILAAIADARPLPPAPWPDPRAFHGDVSALLSRSGVVAGPPGSGRHRMVREARYQWYRRGYRSIAGQARPDRAYSALAALVRALLAGLDADAQRALLGAQADILAPLQPEAPRGEHWPPSPAALADALAAVLGRAAPLAVVIWGADDADPGTARVLPLLARALRSDVRLWATARAPIAGLPPIAPPPWGPQAERAVLQEYLPDNVRMPSAAAQQPLESAARGWRLLASVRSQPGPAHPVPDGLAVLSLLEEPFPLPLAELLTDGALRALIEAGHVRADDMQQARLADAGTRRLARARCPDVAAEHARIVAQWRQLPAGWRDPAAIARHTLLAGLPPRQAIQDAAQAGLRAGFPAEAERWLRLLDLTGDGPRDFLTDYARIWADLLLHPEAVSPEATGALTARASDAEQRAMAEALGLMYLARRGEDRARAIDNGSQMAARLAAAMPHLAAEILREVAAAQLADGDAQGAVRSGRDAVALLERIRASDAAPTRRDVEVSDTLAAALMAGSRPAEAVRLCSLIAAGCFSARMWWGEAISRARLGRGLLALGRRPEAADNAARARRLQPRHSDPALLARCAILQARLAIEAGALRAGRVDLAVARTAARGMRDSAMLAEACALSLEVAVHAADPDEARQAREEFDALPQPAAPTDHFPAALGRWLWLAGDLHGALQAVRAPRAGHAGLCVRAERARLLLISGQYADASRLAGTLTREAAEHQMEELALFGRLVSGAAIGERDTSFLPLLKRAGSSPWVHLSLGGMHLDALRRRRRGENVRAILLNLQRRAEAIHHRLYAALARPEGW